ncbi:MAG TPA: histidine phosphatase family protein [Flavobacterium sp.]|nr:histidine phosphatase family protein [Flavobacterium sp.]
MIVYLIRHGQSEGNVARVHQTAATPLSPLGETQAAKLAERLKDIAIDEIWTSPMVRAKHTAEIINEYQHVVMTEIDELYEIKRPSSFNGKRFDDPSLIQIKKEMNMGTDIGPDDPYFKMGDGESVAEFTERMKRVMQQLEAKAKQEKDDFILCVTAHGFVVSALFLVAALGEHATPEVLHYGLTHLRHENTGITMLKIDQHSQKRALAYSDFSHL